MSFLSSEDLTFSVMNLGVQVELALAEARLHQFEPARTRLERLIRSHTGSQRPLTLGALHEARAIVALLEGDLAACREHLVEMDGWYRPTEIATLAERCEALAAKLKLAQRRGLSSEAPELGVGDENLVTRIESMLSSNAGSEQERARRGLQIALDLSGAESGFLVLSREGGTLVAHAGAGAPAAELMGWVRERLCAAGENAETAVLDELDSMADHGVKTYGRVRYCLLPLWVLEQREHMKLSAAIALGFEKHPLRLPSAEVLQIIAEHLGGAPS